MSEPTLNAELVQERPEFTVGEVLSRSFGVWTQNVAVFAGVSLVLHAPLFFMGPRTAAEIQAGGLFGFIPQMIATMLLANVVSGVLVYSAFEQLRGKPVGIGRAFSVGFRRFFAILWTGIVQGFFGGLWTLFFIVPGIVAFCRYWAAIPVSVVEDSSGTAALERSKGLTEGHRWPIFGLMFIVVVVSGISNASIGAALARYELGARVAQLLVTAFYSSFSAVMYTVGYYTLRAVKEGLDIEAVADVFN
jgi:hypothetical protein